MKKSIITLLALILTLSVFVGCDTTKDPEPTQTDEITQTPTEDPTDAPTSAPTSVPTLNETEDPTSAPTNDPTDTQTDVPAPVPSDEPTAAPTENTTVTPTEKQTTAPTEDVGNNPTEVPTTAPTKEPTTAPTEKGTETPTEKITDAPTEQIPVIPTEQPSNAPTEKPTQAPTDDSTTGPTEQPSVAPTERPTSAPTEEQPTQPAEKPTQAPTEAPTQTPAEKPTEQATETETHVHVHGEWVLQGEPGCEDERSYTAKCECGDTISKTEPATGHDEVVTKGSLPTLTETGRTEHIVCDRCGEVLKESVTVPTLTVTETPILTDVTYEGNNAGKLTFHWKVEQSFEDTFLGMTVSAKKGSVVIASFDVMNTDKTWVFEAEGGLGKYTFTFTPINSDGSMGAAVEREFYWFPDVYGMAIPRVEIHTLEGELPTYTRVDCPAGCWGAGITDADYVQSIVSVYSASNTLLYTSESSGYDGAKIKVRGNTSAQQSKKPFKIKLDKKFDLLAEFVERDPNVDYRNKEWLLMKSGYSSNIAIGSAVSELVGNDWTPQYTYVTLFVNGEYRGLYILMEGVDDSEARCNVSDDGYIVEMDAYWWNEDMYFTTPISENRPAKFTFKHPDTDDFTEEDECYAYIKNYLTELENVMLGKAEGDINDYLDMRTFAKWMLTHDLLASWDSGGSNMYMTKYDNTSSSKMRMGPVWDYDSIFWSREKYKTDTFARIRYEGHFYMSYLAEDADFQRLYREEFNAVKNKVRTSVSELFEFFKSETYATLLQREKQRWGTGIVDQAAEEELILAWFDEHIAWMEENVPDPIIPPAHDDNEGEWDIQ